MKRLLIKLIDLYQKTISPDSGWLKSFFPGGYCKYEPHCSEYCKQSIGKYGVIKGGAKGIFRIIRCNPWSSGGYDPIE